MDLTHFTLLCSLCFCLELNRCQIDLNDLNRLVQKLLCLESGAAFNNGELQRIISMQVRTGVQPSRNPHNLNGLWFG